MKQQKQIQIFLYDILPEPDNKRIIEMQERLLEHYIFSLANKSKEQRKMLADIILPRIALYKAFLKDEKYSTQAYELTRKYITDVVAIGQHRKTIKMEMLPFFYEIYSFIFLHIMKKTDLQKSTVIRGKGYYDITITNCLWYNACVENGCANLCVAFCEVDDINYGNLRKLGFHRTQTLGTGGKCCDFHFYKK